MKNLLKNIKALCIGLLIAFIIAEVILRIFDPIPFPQRGDEIVPIKNSQQTYSNDVNPKLPDEILVSTNSLGFRGPELPKERGLRIITVGGSTTYCPFNSDDHTWSSLLYQQLNSQYEGIWLNNAGLNGHSTGGIWS